MQPHNLSQPSSPSSYSINQWDAIHLTSFGVCATISATGFVSPLALPYIHINYLTISLDCVPKLVPLFNCCASLHKLLVHTSLCFNFFISKTSNNNIYPLELWRLSDLDIKAWKIVLAHRWCWTNLINGDDDGYYYPLQGLAWGLKVLCGHFAYSVDRQEGVQVDKLFGEIELGQRWWKWKEVDRLERDCRG